VTNFQNLETGRDEVPWNEFRCSLFREDADRSSAVILQAIGCRHALTGSDERKLRRALEERRPADAMEEMGVGVMREAAARPLAGGLVGKDISSAVLDADRSGEVSEKPNELSVVVAGRYHLFDAATVWHGVDLVVSLRNGAFNVGDVASEPRDATEPLWLPKVGRNKPCPCGSGKKYKKCHGA